MKKILFIFLLGLSISSYGQVAMKINTLAILKSTIGAEGMIALMVGTSNISDNNSGFYYWNPTSIATPDDVSVIQVTDQIVGLIVTGRWILVRTVSVKAGSYLSSGIALTTAYVVTHNLGAIPSQVFTQPTSTNAAVVSWITNKTATTFTINFITVPVIGTNNISFDWLVRL